LDRYSSLSTPLTWNRLFQSMACRCINTLTIGKYNGSCRPLAVSILSSTVSQCVDSVSSSNRLQLNADKTEVMWCTSTRKLTQRPSSSLPVAGALVQPVDAVRDLGVYIDCDLGASTHVRRTVSLCFAALRQLRHLRRYVTDDCFLSLVVSLAHTRLDYGNYV